MLKILFSELTTKLLDYCETLPCMVPLPFQIRQRRYWLFDSGWAVKGSFFQQKVESSTAMKPVQSNCSRILTLLESITAKPLSSDTRKKKTKFRIKNDILNHFSADLKHQNYYIFEDMLISSISICYFAANETGCVITKFEKQHYKNFKISQFSYVCPLWNTESVVFLPKKKQTLLKNSWIICFAY